jgi:phosphoglycolate phosphatase
VLFDFDGTLVPCLDLPALKRQVVDHARSHGVPARVVDGLHILETVAAARAWLQRRGADADAFAASAGALIHAVEMAAAATTEPFPGVRALLVALRGRGLRIGIVTRNCEAAVRRMLPDVDALTDAFLPREHACHLKPDPRHLRQCLDALDCAPPHAAMVGDAAIDMQVGRALDLYCVGVTSGGADAATLAAAGADIVLPGVGELAALLAREAGVVGSSGVSG